ncbi:MAG: hypothetical protein AAF485_07205, partial [Chloroflexota bacterium]
WNLLQTWSKWVLAPTLNRGAIIEYARAHSLTGLLKRAEWARPQLPRSPAPGIPLHVGED